MAEPRGPARIDADDMADRPDGRAPVAVHATDGHSAGTVTATRTTSARVDSAPAYRRDGDSEREI